MTNTRVAALEILVCKLLPEMRITEALASVSNGGFKAGVCVCAPWVA